VCGRDHLGSSLDPAVAREPTSDNESNAISIVLPSDTLQHQRIRMKLAKSLQIFAKVLMNLRSSRAQIVTQHRDDASGSTRLPKLATYWTHRRKIAHIGLVNLTGRCVHNETVAKSPASLTIVFRSEPSGR
jgi:hypothetical protein